MNGEPVYSNGDDESTRTSLLMKAIDKDTAAWDAIVEIYVPLIHIWCRKWGLSKEDTEDVGQEAITSVVKSLHTFSKKNQKRSFRSWLYKITYHKMLDDREKKKSSAKGGSAVVQQMSQVPVEDSNEWLAEDKRLIYEKITAQLDNRFSKKHADCFLEFAFYGKPVKQLAEEYDITEGALHVAFHRIRKLIRSEYGDLLKGEDDELTD